MLDQESGSKGKTPADRIETKFDQVERLYSLFSTDGRPDIATMPNYYLKLMMMFYLM